MSAPSETRGAADVHATLIVVVPLIVAPGDPEEAARVFAEWRDEIAHRLALAGVRTGEPRMTLVPGSVTDLAKVLG